ENGGKYLLVSNVDNLAATLSPIVIGAHIDAGQKITFEMAPRAEGDKGGAPARLNDHLEIVEGFRFPADFDIAQIPVFNTNTMIINLEATTTDYPLTWYRADKKSEGKDVVQFERLMGEVTAFVDSAFLEVPREGADGRFLPVKTPDDLKILEPVIRKLFNL
ncbi:UTP--glucose-1-phosphate uridylyltransferase, partial [Myxococcota bacterium]|nr:UTP--glucose-1-phosphate uridylyltransferase [Myxococcota bacterium]